MALKPELQALFAEAARKYDLPAELLRAIAHVETGGSFKTTLTSPKGAQGLMQLMPRTAAGLHVDDAFDPRQAVFGAASYLQTLLKKFDGAWEPTIAAYNAGGHYIAEHADPATWYSGVRAYVRNVMKQWIPGSVPSFDSGASHTLVTNVVVPSAPLSAPASSKLAVGIAVTALFAAVAIAVSKKG